MAWHYNQLFTTDYSVHASMESLHATMLGLHRLRLLFDLLSRSDLIMSHHEDKSPEFDILCVT